MNWQSAHGGLFAALFLGAMISAFAFFFLLSATRTDSTSPTISSYITQCDPATSAAISLLAPDTLSDESSSFSVQAFIDLEAKLQTMIGFGAGLPQASAYVLYSLKSRNATAYDMVLKKLFTSEYDGASLNFLRFPIGSCDFSMVSTTYDEVQNDYNLTYFAVDSDSEYIIDILKDVKAIRPDLQLIATPWSPPSWLKVNDSLIAYTDNNTLLDTEEAYSTFASYLGKSLQAFQQQGLHIHYLALQNEPLFGTGTQYPGMYLSSENAVRLAKYVRPLLANTQTKLLAYDHNWDSPDYPEEELQNSTAFDGIAWHCYAGDMASAQDQLHASFPATPQLVTECTGAYPGACNISQGMVDFGNNHEWDMQNILLGAAAHWATGSLKWIIALDEDCGPTLPTVTFNNGRPLVSIASWATTFEDMYFNQDYWSLAHMSKFLPKGAYRVNSTLAVNGGEPSDVLAQAFVDTASATVTLIAMNLNHTIGLSISSQDSFGVQLDDYIPPFSTKVYQWTY